MHNQVGVAADRRGEMRVGGRGQGEVAQTLLRVARLLQGAQHQIGENPLLGPPGNFFRQSLVVTWGDVKAFRYFQPALRAPPSAAPVALLYPDLADDFL